MALLSMLISWQAFTNPNLCNHRPMMSQLCTMWASMLSTLDEWMKRYRIPAADHVAHIQRLKNRRNVNWHPALALAYQLDPLYAQTATGGARQPGQKLFPSRKLSQVQSDFTVHF